MQLLVSITGSQKISAPMTIVASGIAKMFVGELVETGEHKLIYSHLPNTYFFVYELMLYILCITLCNEACVFAARIVMTERRETGPIRPCHIREAYRRLKLEGKVPKRSVSRLFR